MPFNIDDEFMEICANVLYGSPVSEPQSATTAPCGEASPAIDLHEIVGNAARRRRAYAPAVSRVESVRPVGIVSDFDDDMDFAPLDDDEDHPVDSSGSFTFSEWARDICADAIRARIPTTSADPHTVNPRPASPRDPNAVRCYFCNGDSMTHDDNGLHGGHTVYSHGYYYDSGRVTPRRDRRTLNICNRCFEHEINTVVCDHCGDVFTSDSMFAVIENGERHNYCPVCAAAMHAYVCPICGGFFMGGEGDHPVCENCRENAVTCDICGSIVHRNESITDDTGRVLCENCAYMALNNINCVQGWDYRPQRFFTHSTLSESGLRTPLYMGVEVEMDIPVKVVRNMGSAKRFEATARHSHKLYEMNQPVYFKHDGSLNCGFEIVSHPCTLAYHTSEVEWKKMFRASIKAGFRAHKTTTCGLHVHVNRTFFGSSGIHQDLNIAKIILLVSKFWDSHIVNFSRRDYSALERYAKKPDMRYEPGDNDDSVVRKLQGKYTGNHDDRYYAVNIQNNDTVEFRMFKGTLNHATFLASLQWVKVLCEYVKHLDVRGIYSATWDQIFGGSQYEELNTYMKKRGLMG